MHSFNEQALIVLKDLYAKKRMRYFLALALNLFWVILSYLEKVYSVSSYLLWFILIITIIVNFLSLFKSCIIPSKINFEEETKSKNINAFSFGVLLETLLDSLVVALIFFQASTAHNVLFLFTLVLFFHGFIRYLLLFNALFDSSKTTSKYQLTLSNVVMSCLYLALCLGITYNLAIITDYVASFVAHRFSDRQWDLMILFVVVFLLLIFMFSIEKSFSRSKNLSAKKSHVKNLTLIFVFFVVTSLLADPFYLMHRKRKILIYEARDTFSNELISMIHTEKHFINEKENGEDSLLHVIVKSQKPDVLKQALLIPEIKEMLELQDSNGLTVIQNAVINKSPKYIKVLHENGANLMVLDKDGNSLIDLANSKKRTLNSLYLRKINKNILQKKTDNLEVSEKEEAELLKELENI